MRSACKEQKRTTQDEVASAWRDCCSLHAVTSSVCDLLQYTNTEKCHLFVLYNKKFGWFVEGFGWFVEKISPPTSSGVDLTPSVCVSFSRSQSTTNVNAHSSDVIVLKPLYFNSPVLPPVYIHGQAHGDRSGFCSSNQLVERRSRDLWGRAGSILSRRPWSKLHLSQLVSVES